MLENGFVASPHCFLSNFKLRLRCNLRTVLCYDFEVVEHVRDVARGLEIQKSFKS